MSDPVTDFHAIVLAVLGNAPDHIEPGRRHRFSTSGKRGDDAGWCLSQAGAAGDGGVVRGGCNRMSTATTEDQKLERAREWFLGERKRLRENHGEDGWAEHGEWLTEYVAEEAQQSVGGNHG